MSTEPDLSALVERHLLIDGARRQRDEMVAKAYKQGASVIQIANALGVGRRAIYDVLEAQGVERRPKNDAR